MSFTATTLTPNVTINFPNVTIGPSCLSGPLALAFGWEGIDPDNPESDPEAVRYKLIPYGDADTPCLVREEFESSTIIEDRQDIPWSDWIRYDAAQDSGRVVRFTPQGVTPGDSFIFVVQARDVAGAVTPTFEWGRNVRHVRTSANKFPQLTVTERFLGTKAFVGTGSIERFPIVSKQPIEFSWSADASSYAGVVEAYRYGFNVADPEDPNDEGWFVDWGIGPNWQRSLPRTFSQGAPNFVVQTRDNSGTITRVIYQFQVIQIARRSEQRDLLLVDDRVDQQPELDIQWDAAWLDLLRGVERFQPGTDVIDAEDEPARLTFALANNYKAVVWFTSPSTFSYLSTRLAPQSLTVPRFNWLEIYQRFVGNVLMVGPGVMLRSLESSLNINFPVVFNFGAGGTQGFGTRTLADGRTINRGTERYPYIGWCLEAVDIVDPPGVGTIVGEATGSVLRNNGCDGLTYARVAPDFVNEFPVGPQQIANLRPTTDRRERNNNSSALQLDFDEFYNRNVTSKDVSLNLRSCQVPMFLHIARSDVDVLHIMDPSQPDPNRPTAPVDSFYVDYPEYRLPVQPRLVSLVPDPRDENPDDGIDQIKDCGWAKVERRNNSRLTGATVGVASRAFQNTKQDGELTTEDFLMGFNPFGFQQGNVRLTIEWILLTRWGLND